MVKQAVKSVLWLAIILALLTALIGVTPTEAGEWVRGLWGNVLEFFRSVFPQLNRSS